MIILGNGESRKTVDLNSINMPIIGCNAVFRDYTVDHLVCVDKKIVQEALDAGVNHNTYIYTRSKLFERYNTKRLREVPSLPFTGYERPDLPEHWGSGPYAVLLGATLCEELHIIGFDLYGINGKTNNVYKDTPNYRVSDKTAVDPCYWIYQLNKIFNFYTKKKFIIYQNKDWSMPKQWKNPNVILDTISNL
mgnify:FL=1|jgi:hypothetical protein|tara:strand:- start:317 stop:892 length:576 start_codon:yes stop_codon:yes gene_type:complete